MRQVSILLCDEFREQFDVRSKEITAALGYLSLWGIGSERYSKVSVFGDSRGNLSGDYSDKQGNATFHLMGLRGANGEYTFHS